MVPDLSLHSDDKMFVPAHGETLHVSSWNVYLFSGDKTILENQIEKHEARVDYIRKN